MMLAVDLDRELEFSTIEIEYVPTDAMLSVELMTGELAPPQPLPEPAFASRL